MRVVDVWLGEHGPAERGLFYKETASVLGAWGSCQWCSAIIYSLDPILIYSSLCITDILYLHQDLLLGVCAHLRRVKNTG